MVLWCYLQEAVVKLEEVLLQESAVYLNHGKHGSARLLFLRLYAATTTNLFIAMTNAGICLPIPSSCTNPVA